MRVWVGVGMFDYTFVRMKRRERESVCVCVGGGGGGEKPLQIVCYIGNLSLLFVTIGQFKATLIKDKILCSLLLILTLPLSLIPLLLRLLSLSLSSHPSRYPFRLCFNDYVFNQFLLFTNLCLIYFFYDTH